MKTQLFEDLFLLQLNNYETNIKLQRYLSLEKVLGLANLSATVLKKGKYVESAVVKLDSLFTSINLSKPLIYDTNSFMLFRGGVSSAKFIYIFLNAYLKESGRFTISLLSIKDRQVDFVFQDYNYLANYMKVPYDFFGWKHLIRVTISSKLSEIELKMLILSLPIL
jgi:hypothetical protein